MSESNLIAIVINAVGLGFGVLGIAVLLLQSRKEGISIDRKALVCLLAILTVDAASSIVDLSRLSTFLPRLSGLGYAFWPWIPVCLWGYVNGLTRKDQIGPIVGRRHLATAMIGVLCFVPFMLLSDSDKIALTSGTFKPATLNHLLMALGLVLFMLLWIGHMLTVGVMIARRLVAHRRHLRDLLSETSMFDLRWLDGLMLFLAVAIAIAIADNALTISVGFELLGTISAAAVEATVIAGLVLFGIGQQRGVPDWADEAGQKSDETAPDMAEPRYARSSLTSDDCASIILRLDELMQKNEPWRDPLLNLKTLSERAAIKPYYVTQALNTVMGRNFYDYVNGWRVRAAALLLAKSDASVLTICEEVGFNSKSTFNAVFRKEMQTTPSAYRHSNRDNTSA